MTRATRTVWGAALALAAVAGPFAATGRAQPRPAPPLVISGGGTDLFRAYLDANGVQPAPGFQPRIDAATIVVVIGSTQQKHNQPDPLRTARQAIEAGGAVLIATDFQTDLRGSRDANRVPKLSIPGTLLSAAPEDCHQPGANQRREDTPYAVPVAAGDHLAAGEQPGRVWSLFRGLNRIATNDPSYIAEPKAFADEFRYPLARLPRSAVDDRGGSRKSALFAVGGDGPDFKPYSNLVVADASVYINQMVSEPGTDNLAFLLRTIEYLRGPDQGRNRCVFFENGEVMDRFDRLREALKPRKPPPRVPDLGQLFGKNQEKLVKTLDEKADELQKKDALHRFAIGGPGSEREHRTYGDVTAVASVLLGLALARFLISRSWQARQPLDVPPPPFTGAGAASTGPPGVFERRQRELVRRNNLFEPVRNLMREFFDANGAPPDAGPQMPHAIIDHRAVRKPESLRRALRDMWRIAYGPPMHISAQRWFELEPYFDRLRRAHEDGKWRFAGPDDA